LTAEGRQFPSEEEERARRQTGLRGPAEARVEPPTPGDDNESADERVEVVSEPPRHRRSKGREGREP
jgi:hypothetical protein